MKIINRPVRVAIVGSGPSGFFTASALCDAGIEFEIDIFEKLFAPYGLVRYGVAPDHQNIKNIISKFSKIAQSSKISFYGNINIGEDFSFEELRKHYDIIIFACGMIDDNRDLEQRCLFRKPIQIVFTNIEVEMPTEFAQCRKNWSHVMETLG